MRISGAWCIKLILCNKTAELYIRKRKALNGLDPSLEKTFILDSDRFAEHTLDYLVYLIEEKPGCEWLQWARTQNVKFDSVDLADF